MRRGVIIRNHMLYKYNKNLVKNAQELRKNMTREEKHLWYDFLKKLPVTVNRQKNIGNYIVDFFISEKRIVIEIDGLHHEMEENKEADKIREKYLEGLGIKILRYPNMYLNKYFNQVCDEILDQLGINASELKD